MEDGWILLGVILVTLGIGLIARSPYATDGLASAAVGAGLVVVGAVEVLFRRRRMARAE